MKLKRQLAGAAARGGEPLSRKLGEQQHEQRLRPLAGHAAVEVDIRLGELGRIANGAPDKRYVRAAGLAAELDRGLGAVTLFGRHQTDMDVERR